MDLNTDLELLSNKHKLKKNDNKPKIKHKNNIDDLMSYLLEIDISDRKIETSLKNLNKLLNDILKNKRINTKNLLEESIHIIHYVTKKDIIEEITHNQNDNQNEFICKQLLEDLINNSVNLVEENNNRKSVNVNLKEIDKKGMDKFIINKI